MIEGVGKAISVRPATRGARGGERFMEIAAEAPAMSAASDVSSVALGGMLAMQEAEADAASNREARRDGEDMLRELACMQRDLLGDGVSPDTLVRLASLAQRARPAADRGLRGVLDAIGLRARIEAMRHLPRGA